MGNRRAHHKLHLLGAGEQEDAHTFLMELTEDILANRGIADASTQLASATLTSAGPCDPSNLRALAAECKDKLTALNSDYLNLTTGIMIRSIVPPAYCRRPHRTTAICAYNISTPMPESKAPSTVDALLDNCLLSEDPKSFLSCSTCGVAHPFQLREELVELPTVLIINLQRIAPDHKILTGITIPETTRPVLGQQYTPTAVISHLGRSTENGHFVAITRDHDQWTYRNDDAAPSPRSSPAPREATETISTIILQSRQLPAPHPIAIAAAPPIEPEEQPWTVVRRGGRHSARKDHKKHKPLSTTPLPTPVGTSTLPNPAAAATSACPQPPPAVARVPASSIADSPKSHTTELHTLRVLQLNNQGDLQHKAQFLIPAGTKAKARPHIITLQETGACQLPNPTALLPGYTQFAASPEHSPTHGVAILLADNLAGMVRNVEVDQSGRLIILTLKISAQNTAKRLMIASAYLPSGLENKGETDPDFKLADSIHRAIREAANRHDAAIVGGDFNETRTPRDRAGPAGAHQNRCIGETTQILTDVYRVCNRTSRGYTNTPSNGGARARLDYILTKGIKPISSAVTKNNLIKSTHRPLLATLHLLIQIPTATKITSRMVLRTDRISDKTIHKFGQALNSSLRTAHEKPDPITIAKAAFKLGQNLVGCSGQSRPTRFKKRPSTLLLLEQEVHAIEWTLHLLKNPETTLRKWPEFKRRGYRSFAVLANIQQPNNSTQRAATRTRLREALATAQQTLKTAQHRLLYESTDAETADDSRKTFRTAMKKQKGEPLSYIEPPTGPILHSKPQVEAALLAELRDRFRAIPGLEFREPFASDAALDAYINERVVPHINRALEKSEHPKHADLANTLHTPKQVNPHTYDGLMAPITANELERQLQRAKKHTAAGKDGVNAWWLKQLAKNEEFFDLLLQSMRDIQTSATFPNLEAIIIFIQKKADKGFAISNLRPITLQHAIIKLQTGILANRLARCLKDNGILNNAQQGFIPEGSHTLLSNPPQHVGLCPKATCPMRSTLPF
jgi:exonuclease III